MPAKPLESREPARGFLDQLPGPGAHAVVGGPDDPRMKEALPLMEAFLAIEDAPVRAALVTLAERLVSFEWVRKAQWR